LAGVFEKQGVQKGGGPGLCTRHEAWCNFITKLKQPTTHYEDLEKEIIDNNDNNTFAEAATVQNEKQIENGEATSTSNGVNIDQHKEATYQWNMAKELGVTTGAEHDEVIDRIRVMEKRDRTEAERLGNRNIIP